MSLTQYYTATTLDGFIADADNSLEWLFSVERGEDPTSRWDTFIDGVGSRVMGSTTYEWVLDHEDLLEHPDRWHAFYGDRPAWVLTHRELRVPDGVDIRFASGDVRPVHEQLVAAAGGRNVWSSAVATSSASSTTPVCSTRSRSGSRRSRWGPAHPCCRGGSRDCGWWTRAWTGRW